MKTSDFQRFREEKNWEKCPFPEDYFAFFIKWKFSSGFHNVFKEFFPVTQNKTMQIRVPPTKLHERLWLKHKFLITSIQETSFERLNNGSLQIIWDIKEKNLKETSLDLFWPLQWTDKCPFNFSKPLDPVLLDWQTSIHKM